MITKARENGPDYVYSLMTSYAEPPADIVVPDGMHYNKAFSGRMIAMAKPLYGDDVSYADGSPTTLDSISKDIVNFLVWAAEPELERRKRTGISVIIFLALLSALSYGAMRFIWADVKK